MKNSALQFTRQSVNDDKQYIDGNVAEHLIQNARNYDTGYHWYLSDDEAIEFDTCDMNRRQEIIEEIEDFINDNFNFDIEEFEY